MTKKRATYFKGWAKWPKTTSSQGGHGVISDMKRQGVGGYPKKWKNETTSFMDGPLSKCCLLTFNYYSPNFIDPLPLPKLGHH